MLDSSFSVGFNKYSKKKTIPEVKKDITIPYRIKNLTSFLCIFLLSFFLPTSPFALSPISICPLSLNVLKEKVALSVGQYRENNFNSTCLSFYHFIFNSLG